MQLPADLRDYLTRFTGPEPSNCGQFTVKGRFTRDSAAVVVSAEDLQRAISCGGTAAKERKAFVVVSKQQGIDSQVFEGLLGTADGIIYRFSFQTSPCGGPACASRFTISRCNVPTVATQRDGVSIGCQLYSGVSVTPQRGSVFG
jgi:hypothetical protein